MKKLAFIFAIAFVCIAFSCNKKAPTVVDTPEPAKEAIVKGKYKGILPTASGAGMELTVILKDSTFKREMLYIGKEGLHIAEGKYAYDPASSIVTLALKLKEAEPTKYLLKGDSLIRLDMDGKEITGEMAKYYILLRQ